MQHLFYFILEKISWQVPQASKLIQTCREMPTFKGQEWYVDCWVVLLDLLVNYAKFGCITDEVSFYLICK